jgi:hypothetical protein
VDSTGQVVRRRPRRQGDDRSPTRTSPDCTSKQVQREQCLGANVQLTPTTTRTEWDFNRRRSSTCSMPHLETAAAGGSVADPGLVPTVLGSSDDRPRAAESLRAHGAESLDSL